MSSRVSNEIARSQRAFLNARKESRDAALRETKRQENRADPSRASNRYRHHREDFRVAQKNDRIHKRELEMQALKNKGQMDVADRTETGATKRTGMTEEGAAKRIGMVEAGASQRHGQTLNLDRKKLDWKKVSETRGHDLTDHLQTQNFLTEQQRLQQQGKQFNQTLGLDRDKLSLMDRMQTGQLSINRHESLKTQSSGLLPEQQNTYQQNLQNFILSSVDPSAKEAFRLRALGQSNNNAPTITGPPGTQTQTNAPAGPGPTGTGQRPPIRRKDQIFESRQNGVRSFTNAPTSGWY